MKIKIALLIIFLSLSSAILVIHYSDQQEKNQELYDKLNKEPLKYPNYKLKKDISSDSLYSYINRCYGGPMKSYMLIFTTSGKDYYCYVDKAGLWNIEHYYE